MACADYNKALYRVKAMLISSVMQGGLGTALYEMKKRFSELLSGLAINWIKCIQLSMMKLLNGEIELKIKIPELDSLSLSGANRKALKLIAGPGKSSVAGMISYLTQMCFRMLGKAMTVTKELANLTMKCANPSNLQEIFQGLGFSDIMKMPGIIKGNASAFSSVPVSGLTARLHT